MRLVAGFFGVVREPSAYRSLLYLLTRLPAGTLFLLLVLGLTAGIA
jgi:hypothetical protein